MAVKMHERRCTGYRAIGYAIDDEREAELPLG